MLDRIFVFHHRHSGTSSTSYRFPSELDPDGNFLMPEGEIVKKCLPDQFSALAVSLFSQEFIADLVCRRRKFGIQARKIRAAIFGPILSSSAQPGPATQLGVPMKNAVVCVK